MSDNDSYKIPKIIDDGQATLLYYWNPEKADFETDGLDLRKSADWPHWLRFLETHKSFRYESGAGSFSAVKELRIRSGEKRFYWLAHRRIRTQKKRYKLIRKYLGIDKNLSADKLYKVAFELSQLELDLAD